jgi:hypothetical protein
MRPVPVGTRIRVTRRTHNHSYQIGRVYTVADVDTDGTFRATDGKGRTGNWLRWDECEPASSTAWDRIAAELPDDLVAFLSCFDGVTELELKETVVDAVLATVPDLHERAVAVARSAEGEPFIAANRPHLPRQPHSEPSPS